MMHLGNQLIRRRRALAFRALLRRARKRGAEIASRPYPDEEVGETPPPYVLVLQKQAEAATHVLGSALHADVAHRRAKVDRLAVRLTDRQRASDELAERHNTAARAGGRPRNANALLYAVLLLVVVLEA